MKHLIEKYLEERAGAWSETTIRSETSRFKKLAQVMHLSPAEAYKELLLDGRKPYTIKTDFMRICDLEAWALEAGHIKATPFRNYYKRAASRFKYAYQKEELGITYEEAKRRIQDLEEPVRVMAMNMLETGVRISEAYKVKNGKVIGKGGKPRTVFGTIEKTVPQSTFARKLKAVGLKPHSLRKLWATRLVEKGVTPQDLCKAAGWSSINTALSYLQARDDERLESFVKKAVKE